MWSQVQFWTRVLSRLSLLLAYSLPQKILLVLLLIFVHCQKKHFKILVQCVWLLWKPDVTFIFKHTMNANMADHLVGAQDGLHESEASGALVLCFDSASPEKCCCVDGLVCFISLCLLVFVFLNASRRDRNCPTFASTGKQWIHGIRWDEGSE